MYDLVFYIQRSRFTAKIIVVYGSDLEYCLRFGV